MIHYFELITCWLLVALYYIIAVPFYWLALCLLHVALYIITELLRLIEKTGGD